jgi:hypothetical protein
VLPYVVLPSYDDAIPALLSRQRYFYSSMNVSIVFLGCYVDSVRNRDMTTFFFLPKHVPKKQRRDAVHMSAPAQCVLACRRMGYQFAAVQMSVECHCGNAFGRIGHDRVDDAECKRCVDTPDARCGGANRNAVYALAENQSAPASVLEAAVGRRWRSAWPIAVTFGPCVALDKVHVMHAQSAHPHSLTSSLDIVLG